MSDTGKRKDMQQFRQWRKLEEPQQNVGLFAVVCKRIGHLCDLQLFEASDPIEKAARQRRQIVVA